MHNLTVDKLGHPNVNEGHDKGKGVVYFHVYMRKLFLNNNFSNVLLHSCAVFTNRVIIQL